MGLSSMPTAVDAMANSTAKLPIRLSVRLTHAKVVRSGPMNDDEFLGPIPTL